MRSEQAAIRASSSANSSFAVKGRPRCSALAAATGMAESQTMAGVLASNISGP